MIIAILILSRMFIEVGFIFTENNTNYLNLLFEEV